MPMDDALLLTRLGRRAILSGLAAAVPGAAFAQDRKKIAVGLLSWWTPAMEPTYAARLREGLQAYGYLEGRNLELTTAFTGGNVERTREAAQRFVDRAVDVLVVTATPAVTIAKEAARMRNIPIVMAPVADPVATGLVDSIARPGGNITGMSMLGPDLSGKRLELLREIKPDLKAIAFVGATRDPNTKTFVAAIEAAARQLGLRLAVKLVDGPEEIDAGLMAAVKREGADAVVVQPIFIGHQDEIVTAARSSRLPVVSDFPVFALAGALLTYGIDDRAQMRRAAYFVDRIVKGARPSDLPIELPTEFALLVNLKTAAELGLTVPPSVIQRATEIIE
jgi:putative ABC transport system substrate-binding protein